MAQHTQKTKSAPVQLGRPSAVTQAHRKRCVRVALSMATAALVLCVGLAAPRSAQAVAVSVPFDTWITGTPVGPNKSVATLDISDGINGAVHFKLTNTVSQLDSLGLWQPNTGVKQFHFGYDSEPSTPGTLQGTGGELKITNFAGNDQWSIPNQVTFGLKTNASYEFNIEFAWLTSNSGGGNKRFTDREWLSWVIEPTDALKPLSVQNFLTLIDPPDVSKPPSIGLIHVFSLTDGSTKHVVDLPPSPPPVSTVPEPSTPALLAGAIGLAWLVRRRT